MYQAPNRNPSAARDLKVYQAPNRNPSAARGLKVYLAPIRMPSAARLRNRCLVQPKVEVHVFSRVKRGMGWTSRITG
ncbi:hypothetical protein ACTWQL_05405 [Pseudalkalibacillus sp. R45]